MSLLNALGISIKQDNILSDHCCSYKKLVFNHVKTIQCFFQNCAYFHDDSGDYENVTSTTSTSTTTDRRNVVTKTIESNPRSFSPPRSSNSSGYGTGSSRKSIGDPLLNNPAKQFFPGQQQTVIYDGGMPSFSSGHSSDEQRW